MALSDGATGARAQSWRALALFHNIVAAALESALQDAAELSMVEYTLLDVLSEQAVDHHLRMQQVAQATGLSKSATTRLVARLEARGLLVRYLCVDDRRGIYTELTLQGHTLLQRARPSHDAALADALTEAARVPGLAGLAKCFTTPPLP